MSNEERDSVRKKNKSKKFKQGTEILKEWSYNYRSTHRL